MKAQFLLSGKQRIEQIIRENSRTVVIKVSNILGHKFVKRHKVRHCVEILKGRKDLDISTEGKLKRKDLEL